MNKEENLRKLAEAIADSDIDIEELSDKVLEVLEEREEELQKDKEIEFMRADAIYSLLDYFDTVFDDDLSDDECDKLYGMLEQILINMEKDVADWRKVMGA